MTATKVDRIQDPTLRQSLQAAHAALRAGDYPQVVRRSADAYVEMLTRKPELRQGPDAMFRVLFFPRLGARLVTDQGGAPTLVYDRDKFSFSEAVTYLEFAVDNLVREGL